MIKLIRCAHCGQEIHMSQIYILGTNRKRYHKHCWDKRKEKMKNAY